MEREEKKDGDVMPSAKDSDSGRLPQSVKDDIEGAVQTTVTAIEKDRQERLEQEGRRSGDDDVPSGKGRPGEKPEGEDASGGGKKDEGEGKGKDGEPPLIVPDALVDRAVKAGMSMADARSFQTADALERVTAILEKKRDGAGDGGAGDRSKPKEGEAGGGDDPFAGIPDLDPKGLDPNVYDEKVIQVVGAVKVLKEIVKKQMEAIGRLTHEGGKSRDEAWFDGQVSALGEAYVEAVGKGEGAKLDPAGSQSKKRAELKGKFDVLAVGYKAAGKSVEPETVFKEAVSVVLADETVKAEVARKGKELEARRRQYIHRPTGGGTKPASDVMADVATELDRKFFGKR
jgi:hypothetical protein